MNKPIYVTFVNKKVEGEFESLKEGKFEDKKLYEFIERAIKDIKINEVMILNIILEWFDHKDYERRFGY